ncbi:hypothetical protein [Salmonella enterica]|uniref:hypothetical protein n=1 Tax=Salmonella enterica TaxID=28901 RepID=UPI0003BD0492|nr:hypothetical protein [Salmonella enterica]APV90401.1 hypothetical protein SEEM1958_021945 [Salmonella enterica subsp. enterica serovar Mbandaka str. ATCC 51958]EBF8299832.1 hypothetical protein [Salmonella enterica subsp. enterica serovar Mbandaka]ECE6019163.1 hypothetical protein [Salmonella enterica subsp. enterica]EHZ3052613.1 hypothetical protein [Salmonella enterica subsp. enterica]
MNNENYQAQLNFLRNAEMQAVQSMLLTALQHGFQLNELIILAQKYDTSAALMEYRNGECFVNYATSDGYFTRNFGIHYQQANDFAEQFDTWWYQ